MVKRMNEELNVVIKFGGGLHTRASADEIDPREAADGQNFIIDLENRNLRNRAPFDLIGTVPNTSEIRGGGSLLKADGTVSTLVQAGDTVYEWDGATTFTSKGTVSSSAKLRGNWRSHNWTLDDKLLLTDLALATTVKEWDGTTFSTTTFTNEVGAAFGSFRAKYLNISDERAVFGNCVDPSTTLLPHLFVGSQRSNYQVITVNNRPASSLSEEDPFFLLTPDLKPINALITAFGSTMTSTEQGEIFNLAGSSAKDFAFNKFYPGSAATGAESMIDSGNDILYGRQGRLESVMDTQRFGNSAADDASAGISDLIEAYTAWTTVFNSRTQRVYFFPAGVSEVWVLDTAIRQGGKLSPWMRWKTDHALAFQPTFVDTMLDPVSKLEYTFMGDSGGHFYRMEGTGLSGDGGTTAISTSFTTRLFSARLDEVAYDIVGYIKYEKGDAATVTLTFRYQGQEVFDKSLTIDIPAVTDASYYGGAVYYGGDFYYGTVQGRLTRQNFDPPGDANEFQVVVAVSGTTNFSINEIGLRFKGVSQ